MEKRGSRGAEGVWSQRQSLQPPGGLRQRGIKARELPRDSQLVLRGPATITNTPHTLRVLRLIYSAENVGEILPQLGATQPRTCVLRLRSTGPPVPIQAVFRRKTPLKT